MPLLIGFNKHRLQVDDRLVNGVTGPQSKIHMSVDVRKEAG